MGIANSQKVINFLLSGREKFFTKLSGHFCKDKGLGENLVTASKKTLAIPFKLGFDNFADAGSAYQLTNIAIGAYTGIDATTGSLKDANTAWKVKTFTEMPEVSFTYNLCNAALKLGTAATLANAFLRPSSLAAKLLCKIPALILIPVGTYKAADVYQQHVTKGNTFLNKLLNHGFGSPLVDEEGSKLRGRVYDDFFKEWDQDLGIDILKRPDYFFRRDYGYLGEGK